jgi:hypothetical protein
MFDFRYHLVSLAAVFIALAVGILLGAAISGKLGDAEDALTKDRIKSLSDQLAQERGRTDIIERRGDAARRALEEGYPALMDNRLEGRGFAILFLGPVRGDVRSAVERTLADADSGSPVRLVAVDTPVDPDELDSVLLGNEELARYAEDGDNFGSLGEDLGRELVEGDETPPLWSTLSSQLIEERSGTTTGDVDGAIVVRSWTPPAENADASEEQQANATQTLFEGLLNGLEATGVPVVGVETTAGDSAIADYSRQGISSVDDVDTIAGRLALAVLLAGGEQGHYGVKDSASDGVVPTIEPVTTTTSG